MSRQPSLFDDVPGATPGATPNGLPALTIAAGGRTLSKLQREFNRLTGKIAGLRADLEAWRVAESRCRQRVAAEMAPLERELRAVQRETMLWIDAFLVAPPKGERVLKSHRVKLRRLVRLLGQQLLAVGADAPDPEVEAAYDRHGDQSHREQQREDLDAAAAMFGSALGEDLVDGVDADNLDDLAAQIAARLRERDGSGPAAAPAGGGRAAKARERDAKALHEASQSVREVYRRLASSLHPDRETDAAERERKTLLMQRANQAYGRNDLLELLTMQIELEQIDADHLAQASDTRLKHYCRVLREQEQALQAELEALQMPLRATLNMPPWQTRLSPALLNAAIDEDLRSVRHALQSIRTDAAALRDPARRRSFLDRFVVDDPDAPADEADEFEAFLLVEAFADAMAEAPAAKRRRRRR